MEKGLFIVLEGPDGSGKSTVAKQIAAYLMQKGHHIVFSREPGGTPISEKIRDIVLDCKHSEMAPETEALLYAASRAQHVAEKIRPVILSGKTLICERFYHSSLVYQGIGRKLGVDRVLAINQFAIGDTYPDLVLFLDIDPEVALDRKTIIDGGDRLEQEHVSFHRSVYEGYKQLIHISPEIKVIDASGSQEEVFNHIRIELERIL
ncbi:MAG: dTMP kinase [Tissierellales bacterium]|jgi:dTMP kinase|nr:dTMP kinase [Tissierellales bacterium]MBN2826612.1 dTMP kinase [Tissierellales bacterium]